MRRRQLPIVLALGTAQTLGWASSYYLPAILADSIAHDVGVSGTWVFGAFSVALLISALLGPRVGRQIDLVGGRGVLAVSNIVLAAGLVALGMAGSALTLGLAWVVIGLGMGLGLYDSAFAALTRIYGADARRAITGITLLAGFASTVGWPLTAWGLAELGWRNTCFAWAAAHVVVGLPLNLLLPLTPRLAPPDVSSPSAAAPNVRLDAPMLLLAFAFAAGWVVTTAMAAHLPRLLEACGASAAQAILAGALIGPSQVAARLLEATVMGRYHPLISARLAAVMHPLGAAALALSGSAHLSGVFAALHGAGSGVLTIARGTVPLAIFGPENYGYRLGLLGAPSRIAQAGAPLAFGFLIDRFGADALALSSALSLAALLALCLVHPQRQTD